MTSIVKSDHVLLFIGEHGMHVLSRDGGKSYVPLWHPHSLGQFVLHPTQGGHMLASTLSSRCYSADSDGLCFKNLLHSADYGETWSTLAEYVVMYDWARNLKTHALEYPELAIFATAHGAAHRAGVHQTFGKWDHRVDLIVSRDLFATTPETLVPRGNRFLFTERYIAVAAVSEQTRGESGEHVVELMLASDGGHRWHAAELEYPMTQHSYTILDTSNDAVFLHVNHEGEGARWGNVYLSNALGTDFSLSLPHNRRDANGKSDFEKLQSMEGIYVANYYENVAELEEYARRRGEAMGQSIEGSKPGSQVAHADDPPAPEEQIRTVISFDRGASWEYLAPPAEDALGAPVHCVSADHPQEGAGSQHCALNLHGITDVFGPFYSAPSAVGLLMVRRLQAAAVKAAACGALGYFHPPRLPSPPPPAPLPPSSSGHGQHRLLADLPRGHDQHVLFARRRARLVRGGQGQPHLRVRRPRRHHRHGQR